MPMVVKQGGKPAGNNKSKDPKQPGASGSPTVPIIIVAALAVVLFLGYMFRTYFVEGPGPALTKVAPLPGWPDTAPYNTKEWQDFYKKNGQAPRLSGIPPVGGGGPPMQPQSPPAGGGGAGGQ